jgi:Glycosyl hydrolase family 81 C-terminal domain
MRELCHEISYMFNFPFFCLLQKSAWKGYSVDRMTVANEIENVGLIMTASEVRAAQFYWHVKTDTRIKIYPAVYTQHAIGILWQTMAQFQTWFGNRPFYACGIQLLPLTPIAEFRDSITWSKQIYADYATSCEADDSCESNGWSILQIALLATVGHAQDAVNRSLALDPAVFRSPGGNGHSLTNTIWYLSTRRKVDIPLQLNDRIESSPKSHSKYEVYDCEQPDTCTDFVLDTVAGLYTCRQRMNPFQCGHCNPDSNPGVKFTLPHCAACTPDLCNSYVNHCPVFSKTYVCINGSSIGGCSDSPWDVPSSQCTDCCELSKCIKPSPAEERAKQEMSCRPCAPEICHDPTMNRCPKNDGSQYLCLEGLSKSGCSTVPWQIQDGQCHQCCHLLPTC